MKEREKDLFLLQKLLSSWEQVLAAPAEGI